MRFNLIFVALASQIAMATPLISWVENCALSLYEFTPDQIEAQLQKQHQCFEPMAWKQYHQDLMRNHIIESIKVQRLIIHPKIAGTTLINTNQTNTGFIALVPMRIRYATPANEWQQSAILKIHFTEKSNTPLIKKIEIKDEKTRSINQNPPYCKA